jgi:hypothetical protein
MATLVKFRKWTKNRYEGDITAVFPQLKYNKRLYGNNSLQGYAHIGQHTEVSKDWVKTETEAATPQEYEPLKKELEQIGYVLKICK